MLLVDDVEHGQTRRHGNRVPAEGVEMGPPGESLRDLAPGRDRCQRSPVTEALRRGKDGANNPVIAEPPVVLSGPAEAGLDLACNAQPSILPGNPPCLAEV